MRKPTNKISEAARATDFWPRMYDALTENVNLLKFVRPCVDAYREWRDLPPLPAATGEASSRDWPTPLKKSIQLNQLYSSDFTDIVEKLKTTLDEKGTKIVAVYGEAGAGKSRVVASLFEKNNRPKTLPVWFQGTSDNQLQELSQCLAESDSEIPGQAIMHCVG